MQQLGGASQARAPGRSGRAAAGRGAAAQQARRLKLLLTVYSNTDEASRQQLVQQVLLARCAWQGCAGVTA